MHWGIQSSLYLYTIVLLNLPHYIKLITLYSLSDSLTSKADIT